MPGQKKTKMHWRFRCQRCAKTNETTKLRGAIALPEYIGPCGDSFCYASCDMSSCRHITAILCDACVTAIVIERQQEVVDRKNK